MDLFVGMLLRSTDAEGNTRTERVIWLTNLGRDIIMIDILYKRGLPVRRERVDIVASLTCGEATFLPDDPFADLRRPEHEINEKHRQIRDCAYQTIRSLVERDDEMIFDSETRGPLVRELSKSTGVPETTVFDFLRRFWQRGGMKNALLPLFYRRGWRNRDPKRKRSTKSLAPDPRLLNVQGEVKVGRPSRLSKSTGQPTGVNVNDDIRKRFRWGINSFYKTRDGLTLKATYDRIIEKYFNTGFHPGRYGDLAPTLPPAEELPTYEQFTSWYRTERNPTSEVIARRGKARFNLSHRAVLGDATQMAFGPGSIYQIDATVGDVYLVSSLDRSRIIGRPVIYFVSDTFSHLITGVSVTLEGPSWIGAMLAIDNATADKVAFCNEYGITIEESEWPSCHLPESFLADRGEMEGYNADNLVNALNIRVSNTPPYRGDWKPIVEQQFDLSNERITHWVPGAVRKRERGDKDYRLDAILDLHQFRKLMIMMALDHNNEHRMEGYRKDEYMIADRVEPYPSELWRWGIENRSGHLRKMPRDVVRMNLLPECEVTITHRGIRFQNRYYSNPRALSEQWFERARESGVEKRKAVNDPRDVSQIYIRVDGGRRIEPCHLIEADKTFLGLDLYEVLEHDELCKLSTEASQTRKLRSRAELKAGKDAVVAEAQELTAKTLNDESDRSRVRGIRPNRQAEREIERQANAWRVEEADDAPGQVVPMVGRIEAKKESDAYVAPRRPMDKLRQIREEKMKNEDEVRRPR